MSDGVSPHFCANGRLGQPQKTVRPFVEQSHSDSYLSNDEAYGSSSLKVNLLSADADDDGLVASTSQGRGDAEDSISKAYLRCDTSATR